MWICIYIYICWIYNVSIIHGKSMHGLPRPRLRELRFGGSRSEVSFSLSLSSHGESNKDQRACAACGFVPRKTWLWYLKIWWNRQIPMVYHRIAFEIGIWDKPCWVSSLEGRGISTNSSDMIWCWYHLGRSTWYPTTHMKLPTPPPQVDSSTRTV